MPELTEGFRFRIEDVGETAQDEESGASTVLMMLIRRGGPLLCGRLTAKLSGFHGGIIPMKSASRQQSVDHCWRVYEDLRISSGLLVIHSESDLRQNQ
jgi:hypothetical protein